MSEKSFESFIAELTAAGTTVYPSGFRSNDGEPFSASAWKGVNSYDAILADKKTAFQTSVNLAAKTANVR